MLDIGLLLDTADFPARWDCGNWTALHGWTHIVSDLAIWGAYTAIPLVIGVVVLKRRDIPFPRIFWLFAAFILACGTTHLCEAIIFFEPIYRISAVAKVTTAVVSWVTVLTLIRFAPQILEFPGLAVANAQLKREIAQRRRVEQQLRESTAALRLALDAGDVGTWRWDLRSNLDMRDANLNRMLGLAAEESALPITDFVQRVYQEDREQVEGALQQALAGRSEYTAEFRVVQPDGTVRWLRDRGCAEFDEASAPVRMSGAVVDITDLKLAEEGLARLAAIVESSPDAIKTQNLSGTITHWNPGAERLYGYTAAEAVGQPISIIIPESRQHEAHEYLDALREARAVPFVETVRRHKDGKRIDVSLAIAPIRDRHGEVQAVLTIARDITERKRRERVIERLNQELMRKNDEMERFVYSVSHDLKSPLVTMLGFVGLLREDLGAAMGAEAADSLNRIERAAQRMTRLIDELLELSRVGRTRGKMQAVDLGRVAAELREEYAERLAQAGAELEVRDGLPTVQADPLRVRQVFDNLLANALKYGCTASNPKITVGAAQADGQLRVFVRDNGRGIPHQYHQRIFQLFERLDGDQEGTGVGLALVAKIMEAHGGKAWVESALGEGATFWLSFQS